ncbi:MAG: twin-arginine translocation signal domain-containing protein [Nitrospirae bacterium]|nr:MAG: twin-arginine translocation signal domain-containing protein [Nitrospirota bacterium]
MGESMLPHQKGGTIYEGLVSKGISRRDFLTFCSMMAATLALPASFAPQIAEALEKKKKPTVVWLEFQDCAGNSEAFLRASSPTVKDIVLDVLNVEYHETIMAAAGHQAEKSLEDVVKNLKGQYIAVVEGSIPLKEGGVYCCVGGRTAIDIAKEVCGNALATIAVGTCAAYGGIPAAAPNPTGAVGVAEAVPGITVVNLPGCPVNVENITATVVHFLTFGSLPSLDKHGRPLFAYGKRIHDNCERRAHFDAGQFVRQWGDEGHRQGWCLYEMGCKGPETFKNCPRIKYNEGTSWPIGAGHGCIGCAEPAFWDRMSPFYRRLPHPPGFGVEKTADKVGAGLAAVTGAAIVAHGIGRIVSGGKKESE